MGRLINKPLHFGFTRSKSGNGRLDYTPWIQAVISPQSINKSFNLPIVVLTDRYTASMAELVAMAVKAMPNGKIVGETTYGATGPITDFSVYNDGSFSVGNFLSVYTSSVEFKFVDGKMYEGKGFPPDIHVPFDSVNFLIGKDTQLESAVSLIK